MLSDLLKAIDQGLVIGLSKQDAMEAMGLRTAILTCLGTVPDNIVKRAALESLDRYASCHLFDPQRPLARGMVCPQCTRDSAVVAFVVMVDMMRAPVGGLLERLLVVIGVQNEVAARAVAELGLPEVK